MIDEKSIEEDDAILNLEAIDMMPRLVYVAREKRASHLHNFKAGALNTLVWFKFNTSLTTIHSIMHNQVSSS